MELKIIKAEKFVKLYDNGKLIQMYDYTRLDMKENRDVVIYGDNEGDEVVLRILREPTIL